jgi:hypothetical protein
MKDLEGWQVFCSSAELSFDSPEADHTAVQAFVKGSAHLHTTGV